MFEGRTANDSVWTLVERRASLSGHEPLITAVEADRPDETASWAGVARAGYLYFVDRAKDVIKRGGENVSASEVERVISEVPGVAEVAFVVPAAGVPLDRADLDAHCRAQLARFKVPEEYHVVEGLPKTSIGKVEKKTLRRRLAGGTMIEQSFNAAGGAT